MRPMGCERVVTPHFLCVHMCLRDGEGEGRRGGRGERGRRKRGEDGKGEERRGEERGGERGERGKRRRWGGEERREERGERERASFSLAPNFLCQPFHSDLSLKALFSCLSHF